MPMARAPTGPRSCSGPPSASSIRLHPEDTFRERLRPLPFFVSAPGRVRRSGRSGVRSRNGTRSAAAAAAPTPGAGLERRGPAAAGGASRTLEEETGPAEGTARPARRRARRSGIDAVRGSPGRPATPVQVRADAGGDPGRRFPDRIPRQVRVPRGRLHLRVTEEPADHRQALSQSQRTRGPGVAQVMETHVAQPGPPADDVPRFVDVAQVRARLPARGRS